MLAALWYDYRIARPNVETAYKRVAVLNNAINGAKSFELTSRKHVQQTLGRKPSRVIQHGIYTIEVYEWPAGLPLKINLSGDDQRTIGLRTHNYYAVFLGNALQRHYKFVIPEEEWKRVNDQSVAQLLARIAKAQRAMKEQQAELQAAAIEMPDAATDDASRPLRPTLDDETQPALQPQTSAPRSSTDDGESRPTGRAKVE